MKKIARDLCRLVFNLCVIILIVVGARELLKDHTLVLTCGGWMQPSSEWRI